ncbi:hypothetical protein [Allobaculum mucilyticum]|uniref:hypothetical protein n=1 Tax=Allobaculum mucilyticum TaxID=2834459 RepID=UPI001E287D2A|nr:hypothetical protein [Allobaculum mucilyticum]UNT96537.1 hypothetical protein KWG62_01885 [Allobaculum mucilyticum]
MSTSSSQIPSWILSCLEQYGNCACGYKITKKLGKDGLIETLNKLGYPCELEIIGDNKESDELPEDGTYILTLLKRSHKEEDENE